MTKRVLVTGAEGFIGSHLVERLVARGYQVKALVLYNSFGSIGWLGDLEKHLFDEVEIIFGDIRDNWQISDILNDVDIVFHLAALISIPYSYRSARSYVDTNVVGTLNILQAGLKKGVSIIHTSTSEVYGTAKYVPMDENHPISAQSPYAASKIAADQLATSFYSSFDLPVKIIRPFNTFGPRQSRRAVIPSIITQILHGKTELELGLLSPTRDFNYVYDIVDGFICAAQSNHGFGDTINLGTGYEISIAQTVSVIAEVMNMEIKTKTDTTKMRPEKSDVLRLCAANKKAAELINWRPKSTGIQGFKQNLVNVVNWYSQPENLEKFETQIHYD
jgi:NAD dependent epimerase/dehydratase